MAATAVVVAVLLLMGSFLLFVEHAPSMNTFTLPSSAAPGFRRLKVTRATINTKHLHASIPRGAWVPQLEDDACHDENLQQ